MVTLDDFEEGTTHAAINNLNQCIRDYNDAESIYYRDITRLKMNLPEGYLQERQICLNYMALQNIIRQRKGHRLKMWKIFIDSVLEQVQHKELLVEDIE
jgi:hypothetical protein